MLEDAIALDEFLEALCDEEEYEWKFNKYKDYKLMLNDGTKTLGSLIIQNDRKEIWLQA